MAGPCAKSSQGDPLEAGLRGAEGGSATESFAPRFHIDEKLQQHDRRRERARKRLRARVERLRNLREGVDPAGSAESASAGSTSSSDSSSDSDSSSESS